MTSSYQAMPDAAGIVGTDGREMRVEERLPAASKTAVLECRGRRHVVRMGNISPSGAMIANAPTAEIGETVVLHLLDRGRVSAQVRWTGDGRIGLSFVPNGGTTPSWR